MHLKMVVMELVGGCHVQLYDDDGVPGQVLESVSHAVKILHESKMVHGATQRGSFVLVNNGHGAQ